MEKYYKSIQITSGDTLWDIANEYRGNQEIKSYIKEIKKMNNLKSDQINDMSYLTIMYYEQDPA
ncbi:LysM repeat protein [Lachnospiraceae bacterium PM6-15]|uniref:LysM peptidoglycan-binding domain-containing protein n=1 Tax=Ohessyouella blattaphilus TaxID=2949333 RepID=UPI003E2987B5